MMVCSSEAVCGSTVNSKLPVLNLFKYAQEKEFAIPAINVTSSSTVVAALEAARDSKAPIILQMSQGGAAYFAGKVGALVIDANILETENQFRESPMETKKPQLRVPLLEPSIFELSHQPTTYLLCSIPITARRSSYHGWMGCSTLTRNTSKNMASRSSPAI